MPQLIKEIEGVIIPDLKGSARLMVPIEGDIQNSDYIDLESFKGYMQNLNFTNENSNIIAPLEFGLKNNTESTTLIVEY